MATFNLVRNSRVLFTTNVNSTGIIQASGFTAANTQELQVLDGFSFSQASNADTVTISEAGNTPVRGQRSFNTSLANVEFSFSTYIRPKLPSTVVTAEESVLWNALLSNTDTGGAAAFTSTTSTTGTAVTAAGLLTLVGTGYTTTGLAVGETYVIKGVTGVGASQFNTAVKILTLSSTTITAQYATAPTAALVVAGFANISMTKTAWNDYVAAATDTAGPAYAGAGVAYSSVTTALSNKNQLLAFGMLITVDGVTYAIDNAAMDQAVIDFGLDGIAMVAWTGKGTALRQLATVVAFDDTAPLLPVLSGGAVGTAAGKVTDAKFITNKLSTVTLQSNIGGAGTSTAYTLALTGGSVTIANNITYVTPANLGVVNIPIGYFTGTRAITGSLTAYLRTGSTNTAGLLSNLLSASSTTAGVEPKFRLQVEIGGSANPVRVEFESRGAFLQIPTIDAQAVMSTTINFTAEGSGAKATDNVYDIENTNEVAIRYLSN